MSLINDALKRARQAQQEAPPPPASNLEFRPIEHEQYGRPRVGLAVPTLLALASVLLLFLLWQAVRNPETHEPMEVKARTKASPASAPKAPAVPAVTSASPAPVTVVEPVPSPSPALAKVSAPEPTISPSNPPVLVMVRTESTNPVATEVPKPPPPKLQTIVFHPTRPSVMINGKTLFVGDKVGEFRVRVIDQESVTLVGNGQTNVLNLPE